MKRKIKYLLFAVFCNIFIVNVYATSINASASKSRIQEGQTVKVSVTVSSEEALGSCDLVLAMIVQFYNMLVQI